MKATKTTQPKYVVIGGVSHAALLGEYATRKEAEAAAIGHGKFISGPNVNFPIANAMTRAAAILMGYTGR